MYFYMSTHVYKQVRKRTELLTGQPVGRRARGVSSCAYSQTCLVSVHCTAPLFIRNLSTCRFWYPRRLLEPVLRGTGGWLSNMKGMLCL